MTWIFVATGVIGALIAGVGLVSAITYNRDAAARHRAAEQEHFESVHH